MALPSEAATAASLCNRVLCNAKSSYFAALFFFQTPHSRCGNKRRVTISNAKRLVLFLSEQKRKVGFSHEDGRRGVAETTGRRVSRKKQKYGTKSLANSKYKCAPVLCIHVSFACNQQFAHCRVTS
jgi:hypothetical protein